ncbi:MAG: DUF4291 domain-containing protein [Saprospiraceae bacterium]
MNLKTIKYKDYEKNLPQEGNHILCQQSLETIIVYQAFNPQIAEYAVKHQEFGGSNYSYGRMSWIKPNFLWMMYRCGWAKKENQKRVLAIEIQKKDFEKILKEAVHSSYQAKIYDTREDWQEALKNSEVRIQWDPDHDPKGEKLKRRAIQLGMRGEILDKFGKEWIVKIEDITEFVKNEGKKVELNELDELDVMNEEKYELESAELRKKLLID